MRPELKYGLITGVAASLLLAAGYHFGSHGFRLGLSQSGGYFSGVVLLAMLFPLLRQKQAAAVGGRLTWSQGIFSGLFASLVAALLICGLLIVYHRFINPYWLDNALDWRVARMRAEGIAETAIRQEITFYRQAGSPAGLIATTLFGMTLMGGLSSIVLILYLRPRPEAPPG
jgi:hypothetical protein